MPRTIPVNRTALILALLMVAASIAACVAKPTAMLAKERPEISLETMIPASFGDWREEPLSHMQVVNPETQELLDRLYSQILDRVYVDESGHRIMLAIAYGNSQHRSLEAHKPEICYPAHGFTVHTNEAHRLETGFGDIPVRRLFTSLQSRTEPVTYWFTVGDFAVQGTTQKRLIDLRYGLTGRIPDGLLFRVSSIDPDPARAYEVQDRFVHQLLQALTAEERLRLAGLGHAS